MIDIRVIDDLAQRLAALVPGNLASAQDDVSSTFKATLQAGLGKLNLVTREEFDVQRMVLLRTREKIEALEKQVVALEQALTRVTAGH